MPSPSLYCHIHQLPLLKRVSASSRPMVTCVGRTHERETPPFWPDLERAKGVGRKVAAPPPIMAPAADILAMRPSMVRFLLCSGVVSCAIGGGAPARREDLANSTASLRGRPGNVSTRQQYRFANKARSRYTNAAARCRRRYMARRARPKRTALNANGANGTRAL